MDDIVWKRMIQIYLINRPCKKGI